MRHKLLFTAILLLSSVSWTTAAQTGSVLRTYAPDPAGYTISFSHIWWATSINKMLVFYGNTSPCCDPNSVRAFDPVTNTWEDLWPNGPFNGGPQTRDNHASFYIPRLDELWVWGGSHLDNQPSVPNPIYSGRFSIAQRKWLGTAFDNSGAFNGVLDMSAVGGMPFPGADPATGWSQTLDMGIILGGSAQGNASDEMFIFERKPGGPEQYKATLFTGPRPPPRAQAENSMAAAGKDFYLYGGMYQVWPTPGDSGYRNRSDLWKFDGVARTWTQLADAPGAGYQSILTYDSDRNALVAWVNDKIFEYDIASGQWSDHTPAGLPCVGNQVGVYAPTAKVHLYEGGNRCSDGSSAGPMVYGVSLSGSGTVVSPPPAPPAAPVATTSKPAPPQPQIVVQAPAPTTPPPVVPVAPAATTPAPTISAATSSSAPVAGWLNIPLRTWVSRPYPPATPDTKAQFVGQRGYGPSPFGSGLKHQRLVYNPDNKRVYFFSGDFNGGPQFNGGLRSDMYSYDITKSVSSNPSDLQNWTVEWPFCGFPGQISPTHTDEAPFTWDSKRHVFWLTGGYERQSEDTVSKCNNGAIFYGSSAATATSEGNAHPGDLLQFDPARNRYSRPDAKYQFPPPTVLLPGAQLPRHSIYNPVNDEIIMMGEDGGGNFAARLNAETGVWTRDSLPTDAIDGSYINDGHMIHEQLALDVENQFIYVIDTYHKQDPDPNHRFRLFRYDLARHNMTSLGWIPLPLSGNQPNFCGGGYNGCTQFPYYVPPFDSTMLVYDSINKVVLWPASSNEGRPIMMIYHPDPAGGKKGSWEIDPMNRDKPGEVVYGSNGTFIPELNVMIMYGGFGNGSGNVDTGAVQNYFWLYRYGNGDGKPYVPPTPTSVAALPEVVPPPPAPPVVVSPPAPIATPPAAAPQPVTSGPAGYTFCAIENQSCNFSGQKSVAYGANNNFAILNLTGGTACTNAVFGDPLYGTLKACYIKDVTQAPAPPASSLTQSSTLKATYVGVTGEDRVGRVNQTSANGMPDFHISVSGLRGTPSKVTITSDTGGIWETPFNGFNWIIATQSSGQNAEYWFEQFTSKKFHVKVRYTDGTADEADAANQVAPSSTPSVTPVTPPPTPSTPTPQPAVPVQTTPSVGTAPAPVTPPPAVVSQPKPTTPPPAPVVVSPPVTVTAPLPQQVIVPPPTPPTPQPPAVVSAPVTSAPPVNQLPTAKLSASPGTGVAGTSVTFDASGSLDRDGTIASYVWNFGDQTPLGQGAKVVHGYAKAGTYTATLTVTDNQGATATTSVQISMSPPPSQQPCTGRGLLTNCSRPLIVPNGR
jgi:PKD repeat protein